MMLRPTAAPVLKGRHFIGLIVAMATALPAWAAPLIKSITSVAQAQGETVRIELTEALGALPDGFSVQTPPRVALDLPGVGSTLAESAVQLGQGNVRSVTVAQSGDRTRLVLALKQPATYRAELQGKALLIHVDAATAVATPVAPVAGSIVTAQAPASLPALSVQGIDFRRGSDGAGRLIINLSDPSIAVDLKQQGAGLVVEMPRTTLPADLRRRLDVADFGTPVQWVTAAQQADKVQLTVEPRGAWEHSAYQTDSQFVLEVRPVKMDPNRISQGGGYTGQKVSLNFQNIEVRALLQVIADISDFNIVTSDTVSGNLTLRLKDVPWDQALDIILQAKGLGMRKAGNVLWVAPKDDMLAKEQVDLESQKKIADLEPVRTQSFQLNYTKAQDVAQSLSGAGAISGSAAGSNASRILSARGSVLFEARTNQLFVSDVPSKLEEIAMMIAKIDIPVRQVMIEARIVEADDKFGRALGVKLGATDLRGVRGGMPGWNVAGGTNIAIAPNYNAVGGTTLQPGAGLSYNDSQFVSLPANTTSLGGAAAATLGLSLFSAAANRFLNLEISALEAEGRGKIVSSPRVVTTDQIKAVVEQGEELPYQVASSSGATAVQFKKASLKLEVMPQITPEGNVILNVDVAKDSRGALTPAGPAIDTKHVQTQVLVENGGTVVIGGIYMQDERDSINKVPVLGDVPYLGNLFKNKVRSANRTELLVFITPKIVTERDAVR